MTVLKSPGEVEAVLFDAVGTLIRPMRSISATYAEIARQHGVELSEDEINTRFRRAFGQQEQLDTSAEGGRTSELREVERWRTIVGEVFDHPASFEPLFSDLWDYFTAAMAWTVDPQASEVLRRIRESGRIVGVASNFDHRLRTIAASLPPLDDCPLFISSEVGWRKPRGEFYQSIEAVLSLPASRLLMVGDDLLNDYHGASRAGWQAIFLHRSDRGAAATAVDIDPAVRPCVQKLSEILPLLNA